MDVMKTPTIQTSRLFLRPLALSDASAIQRQISTLHGVVFEILCPGSAV
jgi:hypothetical protein